MALLNEHFPAVLSVDYERPPQIIPPGRFAYLPATSVDPSHLALNLRILRFIEAARTRPLPYPEHSAPPATNDHITNDTRNTQRENEASPASADLLHRAQALYSEASSLPVPSDRALYINELSQACAILAYREPEVGPMAKYMTQDRREAVADQVDRAILCTSCTLHVFFLLKQTVR